MWEDSELFARVVFCRNWLCLLQDHFMVRCDRCGKEYRYEPSDVFRYEQRPPDSFTPILFLKKNSSDVTFTMSTMIGRIHSASRWQFIAKDHAKSLRRSATVVVQRSGDWR